MALTSDLIDFDIIEGHKENIQSLPSGRSAKALANLYSPLATTSRSALSPSPQDTQSLNALARQSYEEELQRIDEADDPLDIYDRYVKWTLDAYPSASATKESGLLQLLERATKSFLKDESYQNDARYLKLWLLYIKLFCQGADAATTGGKAAAAREGENARDTYIFLSRNGVGQQLALFYESFAEWLELRDRWQQAAEVWHLGIERQAKPVARLVRKFDEFEKRREARPASEQGPSSPALPTARPALGVKREPFASVGGGEDDPQAANRERDRMTAASATSGVSRNRKQKLEIFADNGESNAPKMGAAAGPGGWESIGGLADRKKENTTEARPWAGEKLDGGGRRLAPAPKMAIFKDHSLSAFHNKQTTTNPKTGRAECVFVNLEAVYSNHDETLTAEFCFEELRARHRGWMDRDWGQERRDAREREVQRQEAEAKEAREREAQLRQAQEKAAEEEAAREQEAQEQAKAPSKKTKAEKQQAQDKKPAKGLQIFIDEDTMSAKKLAEHDQIDLAVRRKADKAPLSDENEVPEVLPTISEDNQETGAQPATKAVKKPRKKDDGNRTRKIRVMEVKGETQTVQTNLASPTGPKLKRKKSAEPTMTMCTKEAMDEIYDIFNQTLENPMQEEEAESEESDDDDDYTSAGESTGTGMISGATSEAGDYTVGDGDFTEGDVRSTTDATESQTGVSGYSNFTKVDNVQEHDDELAETGEIADASFSAPQDSDSHPAPEADLITPTSPGPQGVTHATRFIPVPPEDYSVPTQPYRNQYQAANNRLPFMTPIVEKTESSMGAATALAVAAGEKDYFTSKTPCRKKGGITPTIPEVNGELWSSPFEADVREDKENLADVKVPQPALPKPAKPSKEPLGISKIEKQRQLPGQKPKEATQKGPIILDAQCNPVDEQIRNQILESAQPPLASYDGYHDRREQNCGKGNEIRKFTRALAKLSKNANDKTSTNLSLPPALRFEGSDHVYNVKRELGKGAFAPVYLAESMQANEHDETDAPAQMGKGAFGVTRNALEAIKTEEPPSAWEFYMIRQAKRRLGVSRAADSIVQAYEMHLFRDEGYLIEEYRDQGTLLNAVNIARADPSSGGVMDELVAMFFTIELFRTVEALHAKGVIHGDLKADNVLLRLDQPSNLPASISDSSWSSEYRRDGTSGWSSLGITLIDFGRGIDMKAFVPNVQFIADWETSATDCAEMREMRPWTYQIDYHGLAGIIHTLLFGKYIETIAEKGGAIGGGATKTYRLREGLKRYWQTEIWGECFDLLLNPLIKLDAEEGRKMPVSRGMRQVREKMEAYLETNCEKGVGLKGHLRRLDGAVRDRRR